MTTQTHQADEQRRGTGRDCEKMGAGEDDFLSLRDMIVMILRHRRTIGIFVLVITLLAGGYFFFGPRTYQAEGYLQVIPPVSAEGKVDQDLFDTVIISHLHRIQSAFIAEHVASILAGEGYEIDTLDLQEKVNISRPPKSSVIRVEGSGRSGEKALMTVREWIKYYLKSMVENNMTIAMSQVRTMLRDAQVEMMEKQRSVEQLKSQAAKIGPLITVSRAVDDQQLWKELAENIEPKSLKKLSGIHIKEQEQNEGYVKLQEVLWETDQEMGSLLGRCSFLKDVERILDAKASNKTLKEPGPGESSKRSENARMYAEMLLQSSDIFQFGEPALMSTARGSLFKTGIVFVCSLVFACFCAFLVEWLKPAGS
ncbi:Wzz/FepE/Etk N-terminal domain-containing protein [Verrucomicrobiota bacterium]